MDLQERICQAGDQGLVGEAVRSVSPLCARHGTHPAATPAQAGSQPMSWVCSPLCACSVQVGITKLSSSVFPVLEVTA